MIVRRRTKPMARVLLIFATGLLGCSVKAAGPSIDFIIGASTSEPRSFLREGAPLWAILPDGDGFRLSRRVAHVQRFEYKNPARGDATFVGQRIVGPDAERALIHFAGPARLRAGPIRFGAHARTLIDHTFGSERTPSSPVAFALGNRVYHVEAVVGAADRGYKRLRVFIDDGARRQVLFASDEATDPFAKLAWAGDIDRDGRPDLLLSVRSHYATTTHRLFLSSFAVAGEICRHVGTLVQDHD